MKTLFQKLKNSKIAIVTGLMLAIGAGTFLVSSTTDLGLFKGTVTLDTTIELEDLTYRNIYPLNNANDILLKFQANSNVFCNYSINEDPDPLIIENPYTDITTNLVNLLTVNTNFKTPASSNNTTDYYVVIGTSNFRANETVEFFLDFTTTSQEYKNKFRENQVNIIHLNCHSITGNNININKNILEIPIFIGNPRLTLTKNGIENIEEIQINITTNLGKIEESLPEIEFEYKINDDGYQSVNDGLIKRSTTSDNSRILDFSSFSGTNYTLRAFIPTVPNIISNEIKIEGATLRAIESGTPPPPRGAATIDLSKLNFLNPIDNTKFALTTVTENTKTIEVATYNENLTVSRMNQTNAQFGFYSNTTGKFKATIRSKLKDSTAYDKVEATLHTSASGTDLFQAISTTGDLNPITLNWNKQCSETTDCSTVNRNFSLVVQAEFTTGTGATAVTNEYRYFVPLTFQNPILGKIVNSCSQTANLSGTIICTGTIPDDITLAGLQIGLQDSAGNAVPNSKVNCQPTAPSKAISCTLTAPATAGTYKIVAETTNPPITNEQVGTVAVVNFSDIVKINAPAKIKTGDAARIIIDLKDDIEFISVTSRITGPKGLNQSILAKCHESLTKFNCEGKIKDKIKDDSITLNWPSNEAVPGVYSIIAYARQTNEEPEVFATAQFTIEPGTCDSYFKDIDPRDEICKPIAKVRENGIIFGRVDKDGNRIADVNGTLSRAEFFTITARLYQKNNPGSNFRSRIKPFRDLDEKIINDPKNEYWVKAVSMLDFIQGYGDGTLRPGAPLKMAELAKLVGLSTNFIGYYDDSLSPWYTDIIDQYNLVGIRLSPEATVSRADAVFLIYDTMQLAEEEYYEQIFEIDGFGTDFTDFDSVIYDEFLFSDSQTFFAPVITNTSPSTVSTGTATIPAGALPDL